MTETPRSEVRVAFAGLLRGYLVNERLAQAVEDYFTDDLGGRTPVVVCADSGEYPRDLTPLGYTTEVYLDVLAFVLRGRKGEPYTKADADTKLGQLAAGIRDVVKAHQDTDAWGGVYYIERSRIAEYDLSGWIYWGETHRLAFITH